MGTKWVGRGREEYPLDGLHICSSERVTFAHSSIKLRYALRAAPAAVVVVVVVVVVRSGQSWWFEIDVAPRIEL